MGRTMGRGVLLLLLASLVLGVGSAGGRTLATTTITVEVIGKGEVTSSPGGIKCGNGDKTCFLTFSGAVTLTAKAAKGWTFDGWSTASYDDCSGSGTGPCLVPDGADNI